MRKKVLLTGAQGFLGWHLRRALSNAMIAVYTTNRQMVDIRDFVRFNALHGTNSGYGPYDAVVHLAAMTDVDACQASPKDALAVNRDGTITAASVCTPNTKFVYISTDMVYGDKRGPHKEYEFDPLNVYGETKLAGELMAVAVPNSLVLRTNFFGSPSGGKSIDERVVESLRSGVTPLFFNDVYFSPLHVSTLCDFIIRFINDDVSGVYNLGSRDGMSKAQFAIDVADLYGLDFKKAAVGPANFKVKRPHDMRLDCSLIENRGYVMPTLAEEIKKLKPKQESDEQGIEYVGPPPGA